LIADAIGAEPGAYLVSVDIEVKVLEQAPMPQAEQLLLGATELPSSHLKLQEMVA